MFVWKPGWEFQSGDAPSPECKCFPGSLLWAGLWDALITSAVTQTSERWSVGTAARSFWRIWTKAWEMKVAGSQDVAKEWCFQVNSVQPRYHRTERAELGVSETVEMFPLCFIPACLLFLFWETEIYCSISSVLMWFAAAIDRFFKPGSKKRYQLHTLLVFFFFLFCFVYVNVTPEILSISNISISLNLYHKPPQYFLHQEQHCLTAIFPHKVPIWPWELRASLPTSWVIVRCNFTMKVRI